MQNIVGFPEDRNKRELYLNFNNFQVVTYQKIYKYQLRSYKMVVNLPAKTPEKQDDEPKQDEKVIDLSKKEPEEQENRELSSFLPDPEYITRWRTQDYKNVGITMILDLEFPAGPVADHNKILEALIGNNVNIATIHKGKSKAGEITCFTKYDPENLDGEYYKLTVDRKHFWETKERLHMEAAFMKTNKDAKGLLKAIKDYAEYATVSKILPDYD
jgi:hypothetical protein